MTMTAREGVWILLGGKVIQGEGSVVSEWGSKLQRGQCFKEIGSG